jgi:hypothetical protein
MRALALVGLLIAVSGCSSLKTTSSPEADSAQATPPATPATPPPPAPPPAAPPPVVPAPVTPPPVAPPAPVTAPPAPVTAPPVAPAPAVSASAAPPHAAAAPAKSPAAAHPVKQPGTSAAQSPANPPPPASPAAPAPAAASTLNLADLEQRLRETRAIGVFTKLSLKNQVDDLLKAFRALYRDPNKRPSAELRQRYDGLLLKVLSLLQDGDPPLAAAIASSREAIWGILADPEKFAKMDT